METLITPRNGCLQQGLGGLRMGFVAAAAALIAGLGSAQTAKAEDIYAWDVSYVQTAPNGQRFWARYQSYWSEADAYNAEVYLNQNYHVQTKRERRLWRTTPAAQRGTAHYTVWYVAPKWGYPNWMAHGEWTDLATAQKVANELRNWTKDITGVKITTAYK